jgi:hypothetical protein
MKKKRKKRNKSGGGGTKIKSNQKLTNKQLERLSNKKLLEYLNPKSVKQILVSYTQQNKNANLIRKPKKNNKTSLNYITPKNEDNKDDSNNSRHASMNKQCAESEKNDKQRILKDDFMSVKIEGIANANMNKKNKKTHKKGNKSMNLKTETVSGNQIIGMKMMDDFDLQTLDLGDSEIKT